MSRFVPTLIVCACLVGCSQNTPTTTKAGSAEKVGEVGAMRDNWLSKAIEKATRLEREGNGGPIVAVVTSIKAHEQGQQFTKNGEQALRSAIDKGLDAAETLERELQKKRS